MWERGCHFKKIFDSPIHFYLKKRNFFSIRQTGIATRIPTTFCTTFPGIDAKGTTQFPNNTRSQT